MLEELDRILVTEAEIAQRVRELGQDITDTYGPQGELTAIVLVNGALVFAADLLRAIELPVRLDCMRVSTYRDEVSPEALPAILSPSRLDLRGADVLLIDDVLDTGRTYAMVAPELQRQQVRSLRFAVLLQKEGRCESSVRPDYVGFTVPDGFAVGYGLDFAERYRNLPCIGRLKAHFQNPPEWR